jgi:hypothetical protein
MNYSIRLILAGLLLSAIPATAQQIIAASSDITIDLGASVVTADEDVAVDTQLGIVMLENLGVLPDASDVIALGLDVDGDRFIAFDTTTALAGGVVARPGDVVRYDGAAYSIEFDAAAAGLPSGVETDATSLSANGLLLSFDTTVDLGGGLVVADEDLVNWNGATFALAMDLRSPGVAHREFDLASRHCTDCTEARSKPETSPLPTLIGPTQNPEEPEVLAANLIPPAASEPSTPSESRGVLLERQRIE